MSRENYILEENLISALQTAVFRLEEQELHNGPDFKSSNRTALEQNIAEHRKGNRITIKRS